LLNEHAWVKNKNTSRLNAIYRLCVLTQIFVFRIPFNVELVFDYMCGDKVPCNIVSYNDVD